MYHISLTGVIISFERSNYTVNEVSGFVEVCTVLNGLGVEEGIVTVDIFTESVSATGKPPHQYYCLFSISTHREA